MKRVVFVALLLAPVSAFAQLPPASPPPPLPPQVTVSTPTIQHTIDFLRMGGTHAEGASLADELLGEARQSVMQQQREADARAKIEADVKAKGALPPPPIPLAQPKDKHP